MARSKYDFLFKVLVIGDSGVGKSNLLGRLTQNEFIDDPKSTVGIDLHFCWARVGSKTIKAHMWDTSGQERYRALTCAFYRGAAGAMLVYDISKRQSYDNVTYWLKELRRSTDANIPVMLVGNKSDLRHLRMVSTEEAEAFARENKFFFIETSALDGSNVQIAFQNTLTEIYRSVPNKGLDNSEDGHSQTVTGISIDQPKAKETHNKGRCC